MKDPKSAKKVHEYGQTYRINNKEARSLSASMRTRQYRDAVFDHYGKICSCCGEDDYKALTIDHINNDGKEHRDNVGKGKSIHVWLVKNNFPAGFQPLCWNCNLTKYFNGGKVPEWRIGKYRGGV